jgi:SAM-dependent methyltransferase
MPMTLDRADPKNADQISYWNGAGGQNWVKRQESQEASLEPVSAALLARTAIETGERVVDIGCGTGVTTIQLARLVGSAGEILGIDVSEPMLARAGARLQPGLPIRFERADATTHNFPRGRFDLVFSRFGVMFFADPARSFSNLRTALRPGGRLAFACWRRPDENPWLTIPLRAASAHAPPLPPAGPEEPGMFSFASEERVRRILGAAGFGSIRLEPVDFQFDIARGRGLDEAVFAAASAGPASRVLAGQPAEVVAAASQAIRRAIEPHQRGETVPLAGAIWVVTAVNP